jgi:hypothetical protein
MLNEIFTSINSQILDGILQTKSFIKKGLLKEVMLTGAFELLPLPSEKVEARVTTINSKSLLMTNLEMK